MNENKMENHKIKYTVKRDVRLISWLVKELHHEFFSSEKFRIQFQTLNDYTD